ncbi:hypothetical protein [Hymenobacter elongatus]|uniref:Uncharacterized protein n=1 Tax=Hymenobacter elongatus TaxID=877208 RepID=A0A4Z0PKD6_9BACT|nr:hypothetical protein [Hymenobacter elongatus]TGE16374.1 hypothetical protein E5J99_09600 [Hymenobacter elongatus]
MEKLQTLGLILLGLAFFVWRMIGKMRETTQQELQERPVTQVPLPSTSFDDLLKQMQRQNNRGNGPAAPTTTPGGRQLPHEEARAARSLEQPAARAVSQERRVTNVSLERTAPVARRGTGMQHDKKSSPPKPPTPAADSSRRSSLNARLRSPAELRDAFVLSEILKRKFE